MTQSKFKTIVLKDVDMYWLKLDAPSQYGAYEVEVRTTDEAKANEWKSMDLTVSQKTDEKFNDGKPYYRLKLKRNAVNKAGKAAPAPEVLSADPMVTIDPRSIGNGSKGHIRCFQYQYTHMGKSGIGTQFNAVKITDLVKYEATDDIDF